MRAAWARAVACLVLVGVVHFPVLFGYFQADDFVWLQHGHWRDAWQAWVGSWGWGVAYRPLTRLSYVVDARLFGGRAWGWHAVNLCVHAGNAALVGAVAARIGWRWGEALAVAFLFAVFPMDWESVDWISGRTGLLCVLFGLLAVRAWLDFVLAGGRRRLWEMALWHLAALLSYEPAAVLPGVLALGGAMLVQEGRAARGRVVAAATVACGVDGAFWVARWVVLGRAGMAIDAPAPQPLWGVARNIAGMGLHAAHFLSASALAVVLVLLAWGLAARRGAVAGFLLMCAMLYAPFAFVDGFTERFVYMASGPLAFALVISGRAIPVAAWWRGALAAALIGGFAVESQGSARGMRRAGDAVRGILAGVRAQAGVRGNLVFVGVPDNLGSFYLLRGAFEQAAAREAPRAALVARAGIVCADAAARARVTAGPTSVFAYGGAAGFKSVPGGGLCGRLAPD